MDSIEEDERDRQMRKFTPPEDWDETQTLRKAPPIVVYMYGGLIQDIDNPYGQIEIHVLDDVYKDDIGDDEMHEYLHVLDPRQDQFEHEAHPVIVTIWD